MVEKRFYSFPLIFLRLTINGPSMLTARTIPAIGALAQGSVFIQPLYGIIVESSFPEI
jgi:hypothetical protein